MANSQKQLDRDPVFARFLAAPVGEDGKGTSVTVLSMLARLDVDPWDEAADLTKMPEATARQRLEALLERFKDVPTLVSDRGRVALNLLAFLPRQAKTASASSGPSSGVAGEARTSLPFFGAPLYWVIGTILVIVYIASMATGN